MKRNTTIIRRRTRELIAQARRFAVVYARRKTVPARGRLLVMPAKPEPRKLFIISNDGDTAA